MHYISVYNMVEHEDFTIESKNPEARVDPKCFARLLSLC